MSTLLLAERLDRLERQVNFWRMLTPFFAALCLAALASGASAKTERIDATAMVAQEFDLVDSSGRVTARLAPDPEDRAKPGLVLKYP
jgi:hypothetical protein